MTYKILLFFFFSSRRRHTRYWRDWSSDVCSSDLFHIELVASNIVTTDSSIALVLDRSGSMADIASGGATKSTLLKRAVGVVHSLMQDRKSVVEGKRVDLGGRRIIKKKK